MVVFMIPCHTQKVLQDLFILVIGTWSVSLSVVWSFIGSHNSLLLDWYVYSFRFGGTDILLGRSLQWRQSGSLPFLRDVDFCS